MIGLQDMINTVKLDIIFKRKTLFNWNKMKPKHSH